MKTLRISDFLLVILIAFTSSIFAYTNSGDLSKGENPTPNYGNFSAVLNQFNNYDGDGDGNREIEELKFMSFENEDDIGSKPIVLVLVEPRLLNKISGSHYTASDLRAKLIQYREDLLNDGFRPIFLHTKVYSGMAHQDGQTVLALRAFFQETKRQFPSFKGVVLVGSFPESMLVRSYLWYHIGRPATIGGLKHPNNQFKNWLGLHAEIIAHRADIVLSDLDGKWENLYVKGPKAIKTIEAYNDLEKTPDASMGFVASKYNEKSITYEDFFWIKDDNVTMHKDHQNRLIMNFTSQEDQLCPEISPADRYKTNPIARPDIIVSRINARHIAVSPNPAFRDNNGKGFQDAYGKPQAISTSSGIKNQNYNIWVHDDGLERQLLMEYFERNHAHRIGLIALNAFRPGIIKSPDDIGGLLSNQVMESAFRSHNNSWSTISNQSASLLDYVEFLKEAAIVKLVVGHSDKGGTTFGTQYNNQALEKAIGNGNKPFRWVNSEESKTLYKPTMKGNGAWANLPVFRTMWQNKVLKYSGPTFYIHGGCEVNSPNGAEKMPYTNKTYGRWQNAESQLFYLNGLALASRAKVFNDGPSGFMEAFGSSKDARFGDGWVAYYESIANNKSLRLEPGKYPGKGRLGEIMVQNKRCYPWSLIGDWTLKIKYYPDNKLTAATLYNDKNFKGMSYRLSPGKYSLETLRFTIGNDALSSIKVNPGYQAVLYKNSVFGGEQIIASKDMADLGNFHNQVSSILIKKTGPTTVVSEVGNLKTRTGKSYKIGKNLQNGHQAYMDRDFTFSQVPDFLKGSTYIQTANGDKFSRGNQLLEFSLENRSLLYVAHDDRYNQKPAWLNDGFIRTPQKLNIVNKEGKVLVRCTLYMKPVQAGKVTIGGNLPDSEKRNFGMYSLIIAPI